MVIACDSERAEKFRPLFQQLATLTGARAVVRVEVTDEVYAALVSDDTDTSEAHAIAEAVGRDVVRMLRYVEEDAVDVHAGSAST